MLNKINGYILSIKGFIKNHSGIKNNTRRYTSTIIWVVLLTGTVVSFCSLKLVSDYVEKVNSRQITLINIIYDKFDVFFNENNQIKNTKQSFVEVIKNKKFDKTNEVLSKLLGEAMKIQPKIDELRSISQQDIDLVNEIKYKTIFESYLKAANLQDRDNKNLIEMIKVGLTMNWKNPTQVQLIEWRKLAIESGSINNEIKNIQMEIQNNLYK